MKKLKKITLITVILFFAILVTKDFVLKNIIVYGGLNMMGAKISIHQCQWRIF